MIGPYVPLLNNDTHSMVKPDNFIDKTSITGILTNGSYTKFSKIVTKSGLFHHFAHPQANFTLFVPADKYIKHVTDKYIDSLDRYTSHKIVKGLMIDKIIDGRLLYHSMACSYQTKNGSELFIVKKNDVLIINKSIQIKEVDIKASNGVIHVIDSILMPFI